MFFRQVIGHQDIKARLIRSVEEDRISHAQLFLGKEGSGALPLALAYACYLSCTGERNGDACGTCPSCIKYQKLVHPDLHLVFPVIKPEGGKRAVSDMFVHQWREAVIGNPYIELSQWYETINAENKQGSIFVDESDEIVRKLSLKTYESAYKIVIIWMAEKMNVQAANKLLKILEEPNPGTIFLLISASTGTMLPTILSRLQVVKLPPIGNRDLQEVLITRHGLEEERAGSIARMSDGNYLRALELLQTDTLSWELDKFAEFMRLCYKADFPSILGWVEELDRTGREKQKEFLLYCVRMIRENLMLNLEATQLSRLTEEERNFSVKFSKFIHTGNAGDIAAEFDKTMYHIESNAYGKLVLLDLAIQTARLIKKEK